MCCCCCCCCFSLNNTDSNEKVPRGSQSAAVLLKKKVPHPLAFFFFFLAALLAKGLTFQKMSHPTLFFFFISFCQLQERKRFHVFVPTRTYREKLLVAKCELWCSCHGPVISVSFLFMSCVFSGVLWCLLLFPRCVPALVTSLIFPFTPV